MVAPTVSASAGTVDQGQTSTLTSAAVSTGTSPYSYQWLEKAPGGSYSSISGATSSSYSFVTSGSTTIGSWRFELQVTDSALEADHFELCACYGKCCSDCECVACFVDYGCWSV